MVYCMLNKLRRKAVQSSNMLFHFSILPADSNGCISFYLSFPFKRRAFFLRFILTCVTNDLRIQHDDKKRTVTKSNDSFSFAYHIRCQKSVMIPIGFQRFQQVFRNCQIRFRCFR